MNILIVEDEKKLVEEIFKYLNDFNYQCSIAKSYSESIDLFHEKTFDIIVIDINLPDGNGLQLIQYLKQKRITSGVIVISASNELDTRLTALEIGADDFLIKPFHLSELNARIKAFIRRNLYQGNNLVIYNEIKIDIQKLLVTVNDKPVVLTRKEYGLLLYFISNAGKVVTKDIIGYSVWRSHSDMDISNEIIYTHVKNLRKKLIAVGTNDYIKSIYGIGYKFDN